MIFPCPYIYVSHHSHYHGEKSKLQMLAGDQREVLHTCCLAEQEQGQKLEGMKHEEGTPLLRSLEYVSPEKNLTFQLEIPLSGKPRTNI